MQQDERASTPKNQAGMQNQEQKAFDLFFGRMLGRAWHDSRTEIKNTQPATRCMHAQTQCTRRGEGGAHGNRVTDGGAETKKTTAAKAKRGTVSRAARGGAWQKHTQCTVSVASWAAVGLTAHMGERRVGLWGSQARRLAPRTETRPAPSAALPSLQRRARARLDSASAVLGSRPGPLSSPPCLKAPRRSTSQTRSTC